MTAHRFNAAGLLLLAMLGAGSLSACGVSASPAASTSATAPNSTASTATTSGGPQSTSTTTSTSPSKNESISTSTSPAKKEAIPPVAGDTVSIAELYLQQVGLRSGRKLQRSDTSLQSGLVITTSPYQGDVVPFGSAIDLVVSTGSPGCQPGSSGFICIMLGTVVTMPYILGQTLQQAMTTLALQNMTLGSHVFQASSAAEGTIICTVPAAGDSFYLNMPVQVAISSGNPSSPTATLCATSSTSAADITHVTADVTHVTADVTHVTADVTHVTADVTHVTADVTHVTANVTHVVGTAVNLPVTCGARIAAAPVWAT